MRKTLRVAMAVISLVALFWILPASAQQIYKWQDSKGVWHFSSQGPHEPADLDRVENIGDFYAGTLQRIGENVMKHILERCEQQWPGKYSMQVHCRDRQIQGLQDLAREAPRDIPADKYKGIFAGCVRQWKTDFAMGNHCVERDTEAYRRLVSGR